MVPSARCVGVLRNGQAVIGFDGLPINDDLLLSIVDSHRDISDFALPPLPIDAEWLRFLDAANPARAPETMEMPMGGALAVFRRSLVALPVSTGERATQ
jgi:hypothetical protein